MNLRSFSRDLLLVISAVTLVVLAFVSVQMQIGLISITSNSMSPTLRAGDSALTAQVPRNEVQEGDILVLPHPEDPATYFAHRVISLNRSRDAVIVETQGDANPVKDNWALDLRSEKVPRIIVSLATSRLPMDFFQRKLLSYLMLGVAVFAILMGVRKRRSETR